MPGSVQVKIHRLGRRPVRVRHRHLGGLREVERLHLYDLNFGAGVGNRDRLARAQRVLAVARPALVPREPAGGAGAARLGARDDDGEHELAVRARGAAAGSAAAGRFERGLARRRPRSRRLDAAHPETCGPAGDVAGLAFDPDRGRVPMETPARKRHGQSGVVESPAAPAAAGGHGRQAGVAQGQRLPRFAVRDREGHHLDGLFRVRAGMGGARVEVDCTTGGDVHGVVHGELLDRLGGNDHVARVQDVGIRERLRGTLFDLVEAEHEVDADVAGPRIAERVALPPVMQRQSNTRE